MDPCLKGLSDDCLDLCFRPVEPSGCLGRGAPEARAINRLNAMSDEDLAARGLTRAGEARRILAGRYLY